MLLGIKKRTIVSRFDTQVVVMEGISKEENDIMDKEQRTKGAATFKALKVPIPSYNVLLYGKIDFDDKADIKFFKQFENKIYNKSEINHFVYSNLDYNRGIVKYDELRRAFVGHNCPDLIIWLKQCHVELGKPKYICVYRFSRDAFQKTCPKFFKVK